jgi:hypothetical protein
MDRQTHRMVSEIITILERHGHHAADREHADQAIAMIGDLARTYDGTRDATFSAGHDSTPAPAPGPRPFSRPTEPDTLILSGVDIGTAFSAFDLAADYKRNLAETCADCTNQSCETCRTRLRDAETYDRLADRIMLHRLTTRPAGQSEPEPHDPASSPDLSDPDADQEAGQ